MSRWAVELVGESLDLSAGELQGCLEAAGDASVAIRLAGRHAVVDTDRMDAAMGRTALSRRAFEIAMEYPDADHILRDPSTIAGHVEGTYRLSVSPGDGAPPSTEGLAAALAAAIPAKAAPRSPNTIVKVIVGSPTLVGVLRLSADRSAMMSRDVKRRPFFSPVSIRSTFARALVNLSRAPAGGRFADPFCGGGGVLLEAADIVGADVHGIDIDREMVSGARANLAHFDLSANVSEGDVSSVVGLAPLDAVATDPPYGRSTSLRNEGLAAIYRRMFESVADALRPGGHLAVALPA